jgi:uncharacterized protein (DUF1697 family)
MKPSVYVAFLRGINVGGSAVISMDALKRALAAIGLGQVQTVVASGNVVFETVGKDSAVLATKVERQLFETFDINITVVLRTAQEIRSFIRSNPFQQIKVTPQTRLQVSFLAPDAKLRPNVLAALGGADFKLWPVQGTQICSAFDASGTRGTTQLMKLLEKEFGKRITTRTWNTIERIGKLVDL